MAKGKNKHLKVLDERIIVRGIIEPVTAMHIGWQRSFDPVSPDSPVIKDPLGKPFIPGSSFKGILRGFLEGFLSGAGYKVCFVTDNTDEEHCVNKEKWDDRKEILEKACHICRLFGSSFMGGKLKIKDMPVLTENWHKCFLQIRDGITIDRETRTTKHQGKYDFETVAPGIPFHMEIIADNLSDEEKGMIFMAFQLISNGFGAIGGNVSRGTGKINISIKEIEILKPKEFLEQFYRDKTNLKLMIHTGSTLDDYIKEKIDAFVKEYRKLEETCSNASTI